MGELQFHHLILSALGVTGIIWFYAIDGDNHVVRRVASPKNVTAGWLSFALSFLLNSLGPVELVDRSGRGG
jgi:hypothetical protein